MSNGSEHIPEATDYKNTEALARVIDGSWDLSTEEEREHALWVAERVLRSEWFVKELTAARSEGFERARHRAAIEILRPANAIKNPWKVDHE